MSGSRVYPAWRLAPGVYARRFWGKLRLGEYWRIGGVKEGEKEERKNEEERIGEERR
jgi:hypothetical protein